MPDVKLGSDEEIIGCLKIKGCMWSTPCNCYNCSTFTADRLRKWLEKYNKN